MFQRDRISAVTIIYDRENAIFQSGEQVTGRVIYTVKKEIKVRGVHLRFLGAANVRFTEQEGSGDHRRTVTYTNNQQYVSIDTIIFGAEPNASEVILRPNTYETTFNFQLPPDLPTSFEGIHGGIRYKTQVVFDIPWSFDKVVNRNFTILGHFDLNNSALAPEARNQGGAQDSKTLCCLCCASGPIEATLTIPKRGYVPGEAIPITCEVNNNSRGKVRVHAEIYERISYTGRRHGHGTSRTRAIDRTVERSFTVELTRKGELSSQGNTIRVPSLPPSEIHQCPFINIAYYARLVVDPVGPHLAMRLAIPILVGTKPLQGSFIPHGRPFPPEPTGGRIPNINQIAPQPTPVQPTAPPPGVPPPSYYSCAYPPAYQEESNGKTEVMEANEDWRPAYMYYDWNTPAPAPAKV